MKVSFGQTYVINEGVCATREQYYIDEIARAAFEQVKDPYSDNPNEYKKTGTLLEEKKGADVFIKNKKDGSVSVEVRQLSLLDDKTVEPKEYSGFIPFDAKDRSTLQKHGITLDISGGRKEVRKAIMNLGKRLDNFAQKCREYALAPDTKKNQRLAKNYEANVEKTLDKYFEKEKDLAVKMQRIHEEFA